MKKLARIVAPLFGLVLFSLALWVLHHALRNYHYHDVIQSLKVLPVNQVLKALLFTAINYLALTGYDVLAIRYIQHPLAYSKIALTSFIGYVFSYNVGSSLFSMLGAGAVRYRFYSAWGLSAPEIAKAYTIKRVRSLHYQWISVD